MNRKRQVPAMDQYTEFQNELSRLMVTEKRLLKRIHFEEGGSSSDSEPDGRPLDEDYMKNQPPPCDYNAIKDSIIKIAAESTKKKRKKKKTNTDVISKTVFAPELFDPFGFPLFYQDTAISSWNESMTMCNENSVKNIRFPLSTDECDIYTASDVDVPSDIDFDSDATNDRSWTAVINKKEKRLLKKIRKYEQGFEYASSSTECFNINDEYLAYKEIFAKDVLTCLSATRDNQGSQIKSYEPRVFDKNSQENYNHFQNELQPVSDCDIQDDCIFDESDFPSLGQTKRFSKKSYTELDRSDNVALAKISQQNKKQFQNKLQPINDFYSHDNSIFDELDFPSLDQTKRFSKNNHTGVNTSSCTVENVDRLSLNVEFDHGSVQYRAANVNIPTSSSATGTEKQSQQRKKDRNKSDNVALAKNSQENKKHFQNDLQPIGDFYSQGNCIFDDSDFPSLDQKKRFSKNDYTGENTNSFTVENVDPSSLNVEFDHKSVQYQATSDNFNKFVGSKVIAISEEEGTSLSVENIGSNFENKEQITKTGAKKKKRLKRKKKTQDELLVDSCSVQDKLIYEIASGKENLNMPEASMYELHSDSCTGVNTNSFTVKNVEHLSLNVEFDHGSVQHQATSENSIPSVDSDIIAISEKENILFSMKHILSSSENQEQITTGAKKKKRQRTRKKNCRDTSKNKVCPQKESIPVSGTVTCNSHDDVKIIDQGRSNVAVDFIEDSASLDGSHEFSSQTDDYFYGPEQSQITNNILKLLESGRSIQMSEFKRRADDTSTATLTKNIIITQQGVQEVANAIERFFQSSSRVIFGKEHTLRYASFVKSGEFTSLLDQTQKSSSSIRRWKNDPPTNNEYELVCKNDAQILSGNYSDSRHIQTIKRKEDQRKRGISHLNMMIPENLFHCLKKDEIYQNLMIEFLAAKDNYSEGTTSNKLQKNVRIGQSPPFFQDVAVTVTNSENKMQQHENNKVKELTRKMNCQKTLEKCGIKNLMVLPNDDQHVVNSPESCDRIRDYSANIVDCDNAKNIFYQSAVRNDPSSSAVKLRFLLYCLLLVIGIRLFINLYAFFLENIVVICLVIGLYVWIRLEDR